ncbi:MAG: cell division protein SepF [Candidatus Bathyarchaeia archaeon]
MVNTGLLGWIRALIRLRGKKEVDIKAKEKTAFQLAPSKIYLKALTLHSPEEVEKIKYEIKSGNILIVKIEPLIEKSVEDARRVINELNEFILSIDGDIARLGKERIILTPSNVKVWKEKSSE